MLALLVAQNTMGTEEDEEEDCVNIKQMVKYLTCTIEHLAKKVDIRTNEISESGTIDTDPNVTLPELRAQQPLNTRVDACLDNNLGLPGAAMNMDLVDAHYVTGGKIFRSPRDAPVRKIVHHTPNQFTTRMPGGPSIKFDDMSLCEFVLGS